MKAFACSEVVPGCRAAWVCSSEDEVVFQVTAHARAEHDIAPVGAEFERSVRDAIVSVG